MIYCLTGGWPLRRAEFSRIDFAGSIGAGCPGCRAVSHGVQRRTSRVQRVTRVIYDTFLKVEKVWLFFLTAKPMST